MVSLYGKESQYALLGADSSSEDIQSVHVKPDTYSKTNNVPWRNAWFRFSTLLNIFCLAIFCVLGISHYVTSTRLNPEIRQSSTYCKSVHRRGSSEDQH